MEKAGAVWRRLDVEDVDDEEPQLGPDFYIGVDCEIVTFGFYLRCRAHYYIPRQFLRPATTRDLVQRYQVIGDLIVSDALVEEKRLSSNKIIDILRKRTTS